MISKAAADPIVLLRIWELMNLGAESDPPRSIAVDLHQCRDRSGFPRQGGASCAIRRCADRRAPFLEVGHAAYFWGALRINSFPGWPLKLGRERGLYPLEVRESSYVLDPLCIAMRREIGLSRLGKQPP